MAGEDLLFPGVQVVERGFQPSRGSTAAVTTYGAFIGKSNQGPLVPTRITSWAQFIAVYGTSYTDLHVAVNDFFANAPAGSSAYITRIAAAGAAVASVDVFADDAPEDPGNPGNVLPGTPALFTITTLSPGSWGNQLYVVVSTRDAAAKRFDMALFRVPTGGSFDPAKRNSEYLLEQWLDVSLDPDDSRYMYDIVNGPYGTSSGSAFINVSGQSYSSATPNTRPYPNTVGSNQLSGGQDGSYDPLSFDQISAYQAAIAQLSTIPGPWVLNLPNMTNAVIVKAAVAAAASSGIGFVVIDTPNNITAIEAKTYCESTLALSSLGASAPSHAAIYYPWLYMPAVGSAAPSKTVLRAPGGAVVGLYLSTDATVGQFQAPAGVDARVAGAVSMERLLTDIDMTTLNNAHVNAIMHQYTGSIVVWGARTPKKYGLDRYIPVRRSVIFIREALRRATFFGVFQPNNENLWRSLTDACQQVLSAYWARGGLKGLTQSEAFYVKCDSTNNPPASQEIGVVNIEVGIALAAPAEFIVISITQFEGASSVAVAL